MSVTVRVDYSELDSTFSRYLAITNYEIKKGILYQLRNWLVQAAKYASWGDASIIQNPDPKLVAWLMSTSRTGGKGGGIRRPYILTNIGWLRATKKRRKFWTTMPIRMRFYSREEAKKFAQRHFALRSRANKWIGSFIWKMKNSIKGVGSADIEEVPYNSRLGSKIFVFLTQYGGRGAISRTLGFGRNVGQAGVSIRALYNYKHATTAAKTVTTEQSANQLEQWIIKALNDAKVEIIPNMEQKIAQKLQQAADRRARSAA